MARYRIAKTENPEKELSGVTDYSHFSAKKTIDILNYLKLKGGNDFIRKELSGIKQLSIFSIILSLVSVSILLYFTFQYYQAMSDLKDLRDSLIDNINF